MAAISRHFQKYCTEQNYSYFFTECCSNDCKIVDIDLGYVLEPSGCKPLAEVMLTQFWGIIRLGC